MGKFIDLTGRKFNRLTVIERAENDKRGNTRWLCLCCCGGKAVALGYNLRTGHTSSCGCFNLEKVKERSTKHGLCSKSLYSVWKNIKQRCYNEKFKQYKDYGGRGICMCDEWRLNNFENFHNWATSNGYKKGLTIERIDNNGNY